MMSSKIQNSQSKAMMMAAVLLASTAVSCVTDGEITEAAATQQAVVNDLLNCAINVSSVTQPGSCYTIDATTSVKRVTMLVNEAVATIPKNERAYEWIVRSNGAGVRYVSGCMFSSTCVFDVAPTCTLQGTQQDVTVSLRIYNPRNSAFQDAEVHAFVPNSRDIFSLECAKQVFSGCVAPPAAAPYLNILSQYCGGMYSMYATEVAGQTHAQVQTRYPGPRSAWNKISDAFTFPGITVDNEYGGCDGDSNGDFVGRARACNECGCGPWGPEYPFTYFRGECR